MNKNGNDRHDVERESKMDRSDATDSRPNDAGEAHDNEMKTDTNSSNNNHNQQEHDIDEDQGDHVGRATRASRRKRPSQSVLEENDRKRSRKRSPGVTLPVEQERAGAGANDRSTMDNQDIPPHGADGVVNEKTALQEPPRRVARDNTTVVIEIQDDEDDTTMMDLLCRDGSAVHTPTMNSTSKIGMDDVKFAAQDKSAPAATTLPPAQLRMLSQQTPGRPVSTEILQPETANDLIAVGVGLDPAMMTGSQAAKSTKSSMKLILEHHTLGPAVRTTENVLPTATPADAAHPTLPMNGLSITSPPLRRQPVVNLEPVMAAVKTDEGGLMLPEWVHSVRVWFLILLCMQICYNQVTIHPILTTTTECSKALIGTLKAFTIGRPVPSPPLPHLETNTSSLFITPQPRSPMDLVGDQDTTWKEHDSSVPGDKNEDDVHGEYRDDIDDSETLEGQRQMTPAEDPAQLKAIEAKIQFLKDTQSRLANARDELFQLMSAAEQEAVLLRERSGQMVDQNIVRLRRIASTIEGLLEKNETLTSKSLISVRQILGNDGAYVLDLPSLVLWNITTQSDDIIRCDVTPPADRLGEEEALQAASQIAGEITQTVDEIVASDDLANSVIQWVSENVDAELREPLTIDIKNQMPRKQHGSTLEAIKGVIRARLEVEQADFTGKVDYATILNGASVIKSGRYVTSPSLVDKLPYLNRVASALKLRFYGHGPEVALLPTYPPRALGQCWSFQEDDSEGGIGKYATFSVSLARPIQLTSISIEHPPADINDRVKTAIRKFRVFGFENPDASGRMWTLGSFEYQIHRSSSIIQEYEIDSDIRGDTLPPLQSVTLAIDSNWGMQYSCLYRFRIHGNEINK